MNILRKILVIEDDRAIAQLLIDFLESEGYQVIHFDSALKALQFVLEGSIELITLDLGLPGMGGNAFLKQLETIRDDIPVIVVSANCEMLIPNRLISGIVPKPFDLDCLAQTIENCFQP